MVGGILPTVSSFHGVEEVQACMDNGWKTQNVFTW